MASLYPTSKDNVFAAIQANDPENTSGEEHDVMHNKLADAVNALQTYLGITASSDATSIDYLIRSLVGGHNHDNLNSRGIAVTKDWVNVKDSPYNAVGNGVADDTIPIRNAITAAGTGTVFFPAGTYRVTGLLTAASNSVWRGAGRGASTIKTDVTAQDLITTPSGGLSKWSVLSLTFSNTNVAGNLFAPAGFVNTSNFIDVNCIQNNPAKSIWLHTDAGYTDNLWLGCVLTQNSGGTTSSGSVPAFKFVTSTGKINSNTWQRCQLNREAVAQSDWFFQIECDSALDYNFDNVFRDITCEILNGGVARVLSGNSTVFENVNVYDLANLGPSTANLFFIGSGSGGTPSRHTRFTNVGRRNSALGGGLNDIALQSGGKAIATHFYNCREATGAGYVVDLGTNAQCTAIGMYTGVTFNNQATDFAQLTNSGVINVKDYGATGDGTTNDTNAINAALAAAPAGSKVYFPKGTYSTSSLANIDKRLALVGDGQEKTILSARSASTSPYMQFNLSASTTGIEVNNLGFDMTTANAITCLFITNAATLTVDNIKFRRGTVGLEIGNCDQMLVHNVNCINQTTAGIHAQSSGNPSGTFRKITVSMSDNTLTLQNGIVIEETAAGIILDDISVIAQTAGGSAPINTGINITKAAANSGTQGEFIFLTNCQTDGISGPGLNLKNTRGVWAANNFFSSFFQGGFAGVKIEAGKEMQFSNNWISGQGIEFVGATACDRLTIENCIFPQTSTSDPNLAPGALLFTGTAPTNLYWGATNHVFVKMSSNDATFTSALRNKVMVRTKAGVPADTDWSTSPAGSAPVDGTAAINTTSGEWYFRSSGAFRTATATHEVAADPHTVYLKESEVARTYNIRSVTSGTSDDTAAIQGLHDAAADGDTILVQPGTYTINQLNWTKKVNIIGVGTPEQVVFKAKSTATGPLLNINFASLKHHLRIENLYVDMTSAIGIDAIYLNNLDFARIQNVKVREGQTAFDLDLVSATRFDQCLAFNQRVSGYRVKNAGAIGNTWMDCKYYMTSGAAADTSVAAWDLQNGASQYFIGCEILRTPGISFNLPYGVYLHSPATTDWLFMTSCYIDSATDGTANSANSAALYCLNSNSIFLSNCFLSANDSSGKKERGLRLDASSYVSIQGGRISGSGIEFRNTCDRVTLSGIDFVSAFADAPLNFAATSTLTNLTYSDIINHGTLLTNDTTKLAAAVANQIPLKTKSGTISDADFPHTPLDGTLALNTANSSLYARSGGVWGVANDSTGVYDYTINFDGTNYVARPSKSYTTTYSGTDLATVFNQVTDFVGNGPFKGPVSGTTTINHIGTYDNTAVSLVVADGTFGATNPAATLTNFLIQIGTEFMTITSVSGNTLTVNRGMLGTTISNSIANGATVNWYDLNTWGGSIFLVSPNKTAGPMIVKNPLKGMIGLALHGDVGAILLKADPTFPTNSAMVDFRWTDRATIDGLFIDCAKTAQVGICHRRNQASESESNVGGPASSNKIINNKVINYTGTTAGFGAGYMIGAKDENSSTANTFFYNNHARGAGFASVVATAGLLNAVPDTTSTTVTLKVGAASTFPTTDATLSAYASHFFIQIESEIMLCQVRSSDTLTVIRGMLHTTAATHAANTDVTAYFGTHALRNFIGDFQMSSCNFNNVAGAYGAGIYSDAHLVVQESHVASSATTSSACIYFAGGDHCVVGESYLDTIQNGYGVMIAPASGSINQPIIRNNYFNLQTLGTDPTRQYAIYLDSTNGNVKNAMITGNEARGPTSGTLPVALLNNIGINNDGMLIGDNSAAGVTKLYSGTKPFAIGTNTVDDRTNHPAIYGPSNVLEALLWGIE